jgi:hypothetical protein
MGIESHGGMRNERYPEELGKNPPQYYFVRHNSHID